MTAAAFFWGIGLFLFHQFHPHALPGCPTGGADLCGLLVEKGGYYRWTAAGFLGIAMILITAESVFANAAEFTQFLSGTRWSKRWLFVFLQYHFRERLIRRGYGSRDLPAGSQRARSTSIRCRLRADRYPQGVPRKPHEDPPRLVDVPLEPTFLGNVFAATYQLILATYGLRLPSCWKFLLPVLPADKKADLQASSSVVLARAQSVIWALMNCIWMVWIQGAVGKIEWTCGWLAVAYLAYRFLCEAADVYCDELRAVVFHYRFRLYESAHFPLPKSIAEELRVGPKLSGYLDRNGPPESVMFKWPADPTDSARKSS
ncbi:MAG: hypothetical protein ACRDQG_00250 [Pseudonocardiaceae bacterium]